MVFIWILLGFTILFILWSFLEQKIIVTTRYNISLQENKSINNNISFVLLSDIHNKRFGKKNKRLIKKIFKEKPDFVIIAGDLVTKRVTTYPSNAYNIIKDLSDHFPIYYAYGNHEQAFEDLKDIDKDVIDNLEGHLYESWKLFKEKLLKLGVYFLYNKSLILQYKDSRLIITGLSISAEYYGKGKGLSFNQEDMKDYLGNRDLEGYQILIAHNPVYFKSYISWGADLVLSGHIHGGLIRIPFIGGLISPQIKLFPKYDGGLYVENDQYMVVSRGLGSHSFMPRILNPPEIILVSLKAN